MASPGEWLAYLNEGFMLSSGFAVVVGWVFIRRHRVRRHRATMLTAASLATAFFLSYVAKTLFYGDTAFGGPASLTSAYLVFLQVHTIFATGAAIAGIVTLRRALRGRYRDHRRVAPWTATAWFVTVASGLTVFTLLYLAFPPGPTSTNLLKVLGV
jgi:putative membrane protein